LEILQIYYYNRFTALWILSATTQVSQYEEGKTNLDFLKQETVSGSRISWAICKSALYPKQITMPAPHYCLFTGRMPFVLPNQQCQSTKGIICWFNRKPARGDSSRIFLL